MRMMMDKCFSISPEGDAVQAPSAFLCLCFSTTGACTSGPVLVRLRPPSVGRVSHHADRLRKYFVPHVLSNLSSPLCLPVIHTVPLWDCADLLPPWLCS